MSQKEPLRHTAGLGTQQDLGTAAWVLKFYPQTLPPEGSRVMVTGGA